MTDLLAVAALVVAILAAAASIVLWAGYETLYIHVGNSQQARLVAKQRLESRPS